MKVGILKTDTVLSQWVDEYGEYPDMFIELLGTRDPSLSFVIYEVMEQQYPDDLDEVDAYLVTGSKFSVYEEVEWITKLHSFIRTLHAAGKKMVGICFGHQLIALALGGQAQKADAGWGQGLHRHTFTEKPDWFGDGSAELAVLVSHQDQVIEPAPGARTIAGSDFCPNAVCQMGDQILTFQGHPEFKPSYSRQIMNYRRDLIGEEVYARGMASLEENPETERMAAWIIAFLKKNPA
ncbi:MAG: GMP synthase [Pseudomonadota bacterium]